MLAAAAGVLALTAPLIRRAVDPEQERKPDVESVVMKNATVTIDGRAYSGMAPIVSRQVRRRAERLEKKQRGKG